PPMSRLTQIGFAALIAGFAASSYAQDTAVSRAKSEGTSAKTPTNDVSRLLQQQIKLSWALLEQIGRAGPENIIISPASLTSALDIVDLGADNLFKAAVREALQFEPRILKHQQRGDDLQKVRDAVKRLQSDKTLSEVFTTVNAIIIDP